MKLYKDDKIFNPETGRYVKKSGTVGRRLERMSVDEYNELGGGAGAGAGAEEGGVKVFSQDRSKIMNPKSNRMVAVSGATGRKLLRMSNDEYEKLKGGAPAPKKPVKRSDILKRVIREQQAGVLVRGVQRADQLRDEARQEQEEVGEEEQKGEEIPRGTSIRDTARALAAREEIAEVIQENPEVAIIPPSRTIRDVARAIVSDDRGLAEALARSLAEEQVRPEPPAFERQVTDVDQYRPPGLQRQDTDPGSFRPPELQRQITEESRYRPPAGLERQVTEPTMPAQEGTNYLDILLNVADVLDEITEKLEEEEEAKEVGMTAQDIDDLIFNEIQDTIRLERARELTRITREYFKEQDLIEEEMKYVYDDFYGLEPVEDDTTEYKNDWNEAVNRLNELVEEEFGVEVGVEESKEVGIEEAKEEAKEEGQVFDDLTTEMGMQNMGDEEKRERTIDDSIENLRRNLMNLEFLDSGRGAYMSTNSVPDPHMDAFDHIAQSKK